MEHNYVDRGITGCWLEVGRNLFVFVRHFCERRNGGQDTYAGRKTSREYGQEIIKLLALW